MTPTIRAYRFWHILTFFHNFLLKKQLVWKNRGDTHIFVSGAIYCRMAGKLTLCVWNVDILMKKSTPKIFYWWKKIFLCGNTDMWPHVNDRSVLKASNLHYRTVSARSTYSRIHSDSFHWWSCATWHPPSSDILQEMNPAKQPESSRRDWKHEVVNLSSARWHTFNWSMQSFGTMVAN